MESTKLEDYPLKIDQQSLNKSGVSTMAAVEGQPCEIGKTILAQKTCISDAIRVWSLAPEFVTSSLSLSSKKEH